MYVTLGDMVLERFREYFTHIFISPLSKSQTSAIVFGHERV